MLLTGPDGEPNGLPSPSYTVQLPSTIEEAGVPPSEAGCGELERPEEQDNVVISPGDSHPPYSSSPPTSGWHFLGSVSPALYYQPIQPENLVTNLAEGDVVIWHTGLSDDELLDLKGLMVLFASEQVVGVPGDTLSLEHSIVLTAWGRLQRCEKLSGPVVHQFIERFVGKGPSS